MHVDPHADELLRLRYALWGSADAATAAVERHVRDDACEACRLDVAALRLTRSLVRSLVEPPRSLLEAVRTAGHRLEEEARAAIEWVQAAPAPMLAGFRAGLVSDRQLVCRVGDAHLDVLLHPEGAPGRFAISGQLLDAEQLPAAGLAVTLLVDRAPRATTRTDGFGEFEFDASEGRHFGLRIGEPNAGRHVELWEAEGL